MRALLAPGVALMNRLRYPQKFALVSLVFAIPLGLMMYLWLAEIEDRLAFAQKDAPGSSTSSSCGGCSRRWQSVHPSSVR